MPDDALFERAIAIGRRNQEIIELIKNWCANAEIAITGGVGLVEQHTGLPIGMRAIRCRHARAHGVSGMDLEVVALDFHDRNCTDCGHRSPVRLPNLAKLLGARDTRRQQAAEEKQRAQARLDSELRLRAAKRTTQSDPKNHEKRSLLTLIDEFDRDPTQEKATLLQEGAIALKSGVDTDVEDALFELAIAGPTRAEPALIILNRHTKDRQRLAAVAVEQAGILRVADKIVSSQLDSSHAKRVSEFIPQLIHAAAPQRIVGLPTEQVPPNSGPLLSAYRINPLAVEVTVRTWLRSDEKHRRRAAAAALSELLKEGETALGVRLIDDLLASFRRRDDRYNEGPAAAEVSRTLAHVYWLAPDETEARIDCALEHADIETTKGIIDAYIEACAERRPAANSIRRRAMLRLARALAGLLGKHEVLDRLCHFWERKVPREWDVLAEVIDPLLGTAALAQFQIDTQPTTQVIDLEPPLLKSMEENLRRRSLERVTKTALGVLQLVATEHPDAAVRTRVFTSISNALRSAITSQERWRGKLVAFLGTLATGPENATAVLPIVYQSLTDGSVAVRAGSIRAYQSMVASLGTRSVPDLMHQLVVAMLRDPYVMVHSAALEAIDEVSIPIKLHAEASVLAAHWFATHARTSASGGLAELAARVFLKLQSGGKRELSAKVADFVLTTSFELDAYHRDHILRAWGYALKEAPTFPGALLRLLRGRSDETPSSTEVLRLLSILPHNTLTQIAPEIAEIVSARIDEYVDMFNELWFFLMDATLYDAAVMICDARLKLVPDTIQDTPLRLRLSMLRASAALEAAAAAGETKGVTENVAEIRRLERVAHEDDEKNRHRRDPLAFLRSTP